MRVLGYLQPDCEAVLTQCGDIEAEVDGRVVCQTCQGLQVGSAIPS